MAFRTDQEIDGPLPLIKDRECVISSRWVARNDGIDYWSRLYDGGNVIFKQATLNLA